MEYPVHAALGQVAMPVAADTSLFQYGVLGIVCTLFLWAIIALFNRSEKRQAAFDADRKLWDTERTKLVADALGERMTHTATTEKMRADYEAKHRALAEDFTRELRTDRDQSRNHEDEARREFVELMEMVATKQGESSAALTTVMEKFYTRFVGPRARGGGGGY